MFETQPGSNILPPFFYVHVNLLPSRCLGSLHAAEKREESISLLEKVLGQADADAETVKAKAKVSSSQSVGVPWMDGELRNVQFNTFRESPARALKSAGNVIGCAG